MEKLLRGQDRQSYIDRAKDSITSANVLWGHHNRQGNSCQGLHWWCSNRCCRPPSRLLPGWHVIEKFVCCSLSNLPWIRLQTSWAQQGFIALSHWDVLVLQRHHGLAAFVWRSGASGRINLAFASPLDLAIANLATQRWWTFSCTITCCGLPTWNLISSLPSRSMPCYCWQRQLLWREQHKCYQSFRIDQVAKGCWMSA